MTATDQKEAVRRFMGALESRGSLDVLDEICTPAIAEEWRATMEDFAFTDRTFTVDQIVAEGSQVAILWSIKCHAHRRVCTFSTDGEAHLKHRFRVLHIRGRQNRRRRIALRRRRLVRPTRSSGQAGRLTGNQTACRCLARRDRADSSRRRNRQPPTRSTVAGQAVVLTWPGTGSCGSTVDIAGQGGEVVGGVTGPRSDSSEELVVGLCLPHEQGRRERGTTWRSKSWFHPYRWRDVRSRQPCSLSRHPRR